MCGACAPRYWHPTETYWSLWPTAALGTNRAAALVKTQLPAHASAPPAYVLWPEGGTPTRIAVRRLADARSLAADLPRPTRILEQVAPPLWRELGTVRSTPPGEPMVEGFVCKAKRGPDLRTAAAQLSTALQEHDRTLSAPALTRYLERLDVPWNTISAEQANALLTEARGFLAQASGAALLPAWQRTMDIAVKDLARRTKASVRESYAPSLQTSLSTPNLEAVEQIGDQAGFFLRDAIGRRSDDLTRRGRAIVQASLRDGLGRKDIARQLEEQLPELWQGRGAGYATAVASVATQRARVATEIHSYHEAGIEQLIITATLDERTTPQCFPAGTVISTPHGETTIEKVKPGDYVITGRGHRRKVLACANRNAHELVVLTTSFGRPIIATAEHPILTNRGWVTMGSICSGDGLAIARTTERRGLDRSNVRTLLEKVPGEDVVSFSTESSLLHSRVLAKRPDARTCKGRPSARVHHVWRYLYGSTGFRWEASIPLLQEMPKTTHHPYVPSVREDVREDRNLCKLEVLLNRLPRTCAANDGHGAVCVGSFGAIGDDHYAGEANRQVFSGLCHRGTKDSHRGGRELLARRHRGKGRASAGWTQEKGGRNLGGWIHACPSHKAGHSSQIPEGETADNPRSYSGRIREYDRVATIERVPTSGPVYDLQLSGDDPTYIANGIIVHNCRLLHGQILSVSGCIAHLNRVAAIENPDDIYTANPFLEIKRDRETGKRYMQTRTTGVRFAEVLRSGYGTRDDRGLASYSRAGNQMLAANVGPPPYHFRCRTTTEPLMTTVQIPRGYVGRMKDERIGGLDDPEIEFYPAPTATRAPVMGDAAAIDSVRLPNATVQAREGRAALRRTAKPAVVERYGGREEALTLYRVGQWTGTTAETLPVVPDLMRGASSHVAVVGAGDERVLLSSVLANETALGRDALVRAIADGERWARLSGNDAPGWTNAAAAYRRALEDPTADRSAAARAFLDAGVKAGWLRVGDTAESVRFHAPIPRTPG